MGGARARVRPIRAPLLYSVLRGRAGKPDALLLLGLSGLAVGCGEVFLDVRGNRLVMRELDRERTLARGDRFQPRLVIVELRQRNQGLDRDRTRRRGICPADLPALRRDITGN